MAVVQQPGMAPNTGVLPGLEYLAQLDQILIQQKIELCEILSGCEFANKYVIKNSMGQEMYTCREDSDCLERQCCGNIRSFEMPIVDATGREIMRFKRPLACISMGCVCCTCRDWLQEMFVYANGQLLGSIHEEWGCCDPKLTVYNAQKQVVFNIVGPVCACNWCSDVDFPIMSAADSTVQVGRVQKQWGGFCKETFTDADKFNVSFPVDLDVNMKAVLLGALFLVDFMYFEMNQNNNN